MFDFFKKKRIVEYRLGALQYLNSHFICFSGNNAGLDNSSQSGSLGTEAYYSERENNSIKYSERDAYDSCAIDNMISNQLENRKYDSLSSMLNHSLNITFVEKTSEIIHEKGLSDSSVYKAAQIDRRLFSKMMSDKDYKPSKDTAIALALALKLTLSQTSDLLNRAGYVLSHSNKRDVIIEYFFSEQVYNLNDINTVLYGMQQKTIGRN